MNWVLLLPILISFLISLLAMPFWIKKATKFGFVGKDMNKYRETQVAETGGIVTVTAFILGILIYVAIVQFLFDSSSNLIEIFAITTSLLILAMIGLIDDSLGWKIGLRRRTRIALCFFAAVPLMVINAGHSAFSVPFIGEINSGLLYPLILIPIGVIATSTTFNFLAGFNGLEAGQGIILISALSLVAYTTGNSWLALIGFIIVAALLAFLFYNIYPAQVFPGDTLTYPLGGLIAIFAILGNFEKVAILLFIPYIIETILKLRGGLVKQSFAKPVGEDTLDLKYSKIYSLNHLSILLMKKFGIKPTERRVVYSIWLFQVVIIAIVFAFFVK